MAQLNIYMWKLPTHRGIRGDEITLCAIASSVESARATLREQQKQEYVLLIIDQEPYHIKAVLPGAIFIV